MRARLNEPYPMFRVVQAPVPDDWSGAVFVWDIDKTYLDTRFSQLKHLARIPFELGIDKRPVSGAVALLHALREGPDDRGHLPLHFVSASPPQLAPAIERRMLLDGVEWDSISYKDPLRLLLRGQTHQLKEQIAFKLSAMLLLASETPASARFHLFGDDVEHDPLVSCLFADVLAGRLRGEALRRRLLSAGVHEPYAQRLASLADPLPARDAVAGVWIRLERDRQGRWLSRFPRQVNAYEQASALADPLSELGLVSRQHARRLREHGSGSTILRGTAPEAELWTPSV